MLGGSAIDAVVGALATAFFGSLGVSGVFLLNHIVRLREEVSTLLKTLEDAMSLYGTQMVDARMLNPTIGRGRDADLR